MNSDDKNEAVFFSKKDEDKPKKVDDNQRIIILNELIIEQIQML